ncbi:hypothetical protein KVR01_005430 [Diaporthe batatas]|uniref:uncharacterized protein n=1 Tax=Diaporthe batatas TaxID=748121 RepID=UPI001D0514AD|nr:uncharacterized protein KVR01_005430 [Diaporthe batatas]KAG8165155.1 hypothetical protein KVR01_005430 [Diaporthe batatas]
MSLTNIETEAFVVTEPKAPFKLIPISLDEDIVVQQGLLSHLTEYPVVLGHEGAGIIKAIGSDVRDKSLRVGDQVLLSYTICQGCGPCLEDRPSFCTTHTEVNFNAVRVGDKSTPARLAHDEKTTVRSQFFGQSSFAKLSVVHDYSVVKCPVPDLLPIYAPLGCGFQTGAGTVLNAAKPTKSSRVVVFGLGSVGLAALMAAVHLEVKQVIGVDIVDGRLELAKELGATDVVNSTKESNLADRLRELSQGGVDMAIDCSGAPSALQAAIDCLGHGGQAISVGVPPPGVKIDIETQVSFIPELIELHRRGRFPIDKLCKVYSFKDFDQALEDMHSGKVVKPIIKWD